VQDYHQWSLGGPAKPYRSHTPFRSAFGSTGAVDRGKTEMEIKELVEDLRRQLESLDRDRQNQSLPPLFALGSVEIELSFVVKENATGKGGFDLKIISADMGGTHAEEAVQKIKITLQPLESEFGNAALGTRFYASSEPKPTAPLK
jgi:hypothetical protein